MQVKLVFLGAILCKFLNLGWTAEVEATAGMPTVMEAIIHAMIDFRKEILDNLQLSLEFHTEQLEEIKLYVEHKMEEQETRMRSEIESNFKELHKASKQATNILLNESSTQKQTIEKIVGEIRSELLPPSSCDRIKSKSSGTFYVGPYGNIAQQFLVFCNFDYNFNLGGGWTVFQRRIDGSVNFSRSWEMYKYGFGDLNFEYWMGLEKLHLMTKSGGHQLLVLLNTEHNYYFRKSVYALYDEFSIGNEEENYKLSVGKYSGNAGDSLKRHNGISFSTFDHHNGIKFPKYLSHLSLAILGGWWMFEDVLEGSSNLNSHYEREIVASTSMSWHSPYGEVLSSTMMFRTLAANHP